MVEGNRFIAVALISHLLALLAFMFPKSAVAQKMYFSTEQLENQIPKVERSLQPDQTESEIGTGILARSSITN